MQDQQANVPAADEVKKEHLVGIIIDKQPKESPRATTGHALYILGNVGTNRTLYLEAKHGADPAIANNETPYEVREHEVFYSVPNDINPG